MFDRSSRLACLTALALSSFALHGSATAQAPEQPPAGLSPDLWGQLRAAHEVARHAIVREGDSYLAPSPGQGWAARFDEHGLALQPHAASWTWGLQLERYGFGESKQAMAEAAELVSTDNRITYRWSAELEEWYVNDCSGLEHGMTLLQRPARDEDAAARLEFDFAVRGNLQPEVDDDGRGIQFVDGSGRRVLSYSKLLVFDAEGRELPAELEAGSHSLHLTIDERGAVYPLTIDPVVQQAYFKASNSGSMDNFGVSVAISGDTIAVGASRERSDAVGIDGDQLSNQKNVAGAVYVFAKTNGVWSQQAYVKASNTDSGDSFGISLALDGDTLAVAAFRESSSATGIGGAQGDNSAFNAGAVYIFVRSGSTWTQQAYLKASNTDAWDYWGNAIALSGDTLIVASKDEASAAQGIGGDQSDNSAPKTGAAYVFVRTGSTWTQQAYLKASNAEWYDSFGNAVAISGDTAVVTAVNEDSGAHGVNGNELDNSIPASGAAYVFVRSGTTWTQEAYLKASNPGIGDGFGSSVDISGDRIAVGAAFEASNATGINGNELDNSISGAGAAYAFVRHGTTWTQEAYLKASNPGPLHYFGWSLGIAGDLLVVGSVNEGCLSVGIDGQQNNDSPYGPGAAYAFSRSMGSWSQLAYIKASNTKDNNPGDSFGAAVALSGTQALIGAPNERSTADGVDGDQTDKSVYGVGAAYLFDLASPCGVARYGGYAGTNTADLYSIQTPMSGSNLDLDLSGFDGSGMAFLFISNAPAAGPAFGGTLLVDLNQSLFGPTGFLGVSITAGAGQLGVLIWPSLSGLTFYAQAAMIDPSQISGVTLTNGLTITVCP